MIDVRETLPQPNHLPGCGVRVLTTSTLPGSDGRLPAAAWRCADGCHEPQPESASLAIKRALMALPLEERRRLLAEQVDRLAPLYESPDAEWRETEMSAPLPRAGGGGVDVADKWYEVTLRNGAQIEFNASLFDFRPGTRHAESLYEHCPGDSSRRMVWVDPAEIVAVVAVDGGKVEPTGEG